MVASSALPATGSAQTVGHVGSVLSWCFIVSSMVASSKAGQLVQPGDPTPPATQNGRLLIAIGHPAKICKISNLTLLSVLYAKPYIDVKIAIKYPNQ